MRYLSTAIVLAAALMLGVPAADAQTHLSQQQIFSSLGKLPQGKGNVNFQLLRQQAIERIRAEGNDNAVGRQPLIEQLSRLPNLNVEIVFDFDSSWINPKSYVTIGRIADALHHPILLGNNFVIIGHTDSKGGREYNLDLSQRRADAIRTALVNSFRVPANRVVAVGLGEEQLRDPANPESGINRRVQIINAGP